MLGLNIAYTSKIVKEKGHCMSWVMRRLSAYCAGDAAGVSHGGTMKYATIVTYFITPLI